MSCVIHLILEIFLIIKVLLHYIKYKTNKFLKININIFYI